MLKRYEYFFDDHIFFVHTENNIFIPFLKENKTNHQNAYHFFFIKNFTSFNTLEHPLHQTCFMAKNEITLQQWFQKGGIFGFIGHSKSLIQNIQHYLNDMIVQYNNRVENNLFAQHPTFPFSKKIYLLTECEPFAESIQKLCSSFTKKDVKTGLHEILVNGIEHGHLGIDSATKQSLYQNGQFLNFIMKKFNQNRMKFITIQGEITQHETKKCIKISVIDQGEKQLKISQQITTPYSGRGLQIAQQITFDKIFYHAEKNQIDGYIFLDS